MCLGKSEGKGLLPDYSVDMTRERRQLKLKRTWLLVAKLPELDYEGRVLRHRRQKSMYGG